jgi:hypothetical protein
MKKSHSSRVVRYVVLPLVVAGVLAVAGPASATDYCVSPNASCAGANNLQDFQDALNKAAADSAPDRIFLGAATTYTAKTMAGFDYNPAGDWPVEIIGAGQSGASSTVVTGILGGQGVLSAFGGAQTSVHDIHIVLPQLAETNTTGLWTNGVARRVTVTEHPVQTDFRVGVMLGPDARLEDHSVVELAKTPGTIGVALDDGGQTVRESTIGAAIGIRSGYGGTIDRMRISAGSAGVDVERGDAKITSSLIATPADGSVGIVANVIGDTTVEVDGVTVVGPGAAGSGSGIEAYNTYAPTAKADLHVKNSIIRGYATSLYAGGSSPGYGHLVASYSDYDPAGDFTAGTTASITETNVSNVGDVGFGVDYLLAGSSPLIDAGDPTTPPGLDIDGNPLVVDGNNDGAARRDIGAYEFPAPLPVAVEMPAAAGDDIGSAQSGAPAAPVRDVTAPVLSNLRVSHRVFAIGRARTAISARLTRGTRFVYSLSETAKVVVTIRRVGTKRVVGRLIRSARNGVNPLRFSGRIGSKALKPGRYRAVMMATDAAGNRSAPASVSFRVLKG